MARMPNIHRDCLVSLSVRMHDAQGNLLEATDAPLVYLHGHQDILPKLEQGLEGKASGDRLSLLLQPEDAFGDDDAGLLQLVPVSELGAAARVGMRFEGVPGQPSDGRVYTVTQLADGMALLDGNHPLAGWALRFDIEVLSVEEASAEDLAEADAAVVPDFVRAAAAHDAHKGKPGRRHWGS
jgi:FKBP-type peptidyl-prolyl cis-trans isomerase SlyD